MNGFYRYFPNTLIYVFRITEMALFSLLPRGTGIFIADHVYCDKWGIDNINSYKYLSTTICHGKNVPVKGCIKKDMVQIKQLKTVLILLLVFSVFTAGARKRSSPKKLVKNKNTAVLIQTDSTGTPVRKERTPEEIFEALHSVLQAMSRDMDEFDFNKIHPHLKIVYALYNELRLLATDDSLLNRSDSLPGAPVDTDYRLSEVNGSPPGDSSAIMDSTLVISTDSASASALSALAIPRIKPLITDSVTDPAKLLKEKLLGTQPTSFTLSWDDTSFQKYLIKFEIVQDSVGFVWNVVFEKVDKLKNKTVKVHKYFDVGEFAISAQDLVWLSDAVKRVEPEVLNYFYAKDREKKESEQ